MARNKILIVDDDGDTLRGLSIRLRASGYDTVYACDAVSAVSVAIQQTPDLILLDLGLPAGDGFAVMERLRTSPTLAAIPVVVLTARDPALHARRARSAGAVAFLQKPADNAELLGLIQRSVGGGGPSPER